MATFDIGDLRDEFLGILKEHVQLVDQAQDAFGGLIKTAAYPKGLMPLREAQKIIADFEASTEKLTRFLDKLYAARREAPAEFSNDLQEMSKKADKALAKFRADEKKAREALAKYEDLLVGEKFQAMFEAIRMEVLDLDLLENTDMGAKTNLFLDREPPFAEGTISIWSLVPTKREVYRVTVGYRAVDDVYYGSVTSMTANRKFSTEGKTGDARVKMFARGFAEKLKSLQDAEGEDLFGVRKKVPVSEDVAQYGKGEALLYQRIRQLPDLVAALKASPKVKSAEIPSYSKTTISVYGASTASVFASIEATKEGFKATVHKQVAVLPAVKDVVKFVEDEFAKAIEAGEKKQKVIADLPKWMEAVKDAVQALSGTKSTTISTAQWENDILKNYVSQYRVTPPDYHVAVLYPVGKTPYAYFGPATGTTLSNYVKTEANPKAFGKAVADAMLAEQTRKLSPKELEQQKEKEWIAKAGPEMVAALKKQTFVNTAQVTSYAYVEGTFVAPGGRFTLTFYNQKYNGKDTIAEAVADVKKQYDQFAADSKSKAGFAQEAAKSGKDWDAAVLKGLQQLGYPGNPFTKGTYAATLALKTWSSPNYDHFWSQSYQNPTKETSLRAPKDAASLLTMFRDAEAQVARKDVVVEGGGRKFRVRRSGYVTARVKITGKWQSLSTSAQVEQYLKDSTKFEEAPSALNKVEVLKRLAKQYGVDISGVDATNISTWRRTVYQMILPHLVKDPTYAELKDALEHRPEVKNIIIDGPHWQVELDKGSKQAAIAHLADTWLRLGGGTGFAVYSEGRDAERAFRTAVAEEGHETGWGSYRGTITMKRHEGFEIRSKTPMTKAEARTFIDTDMNKNDKWGPAFAVPITEDQPITKNEVTLTIEAKDEKEALRQGRLRIYATGKFPPNATILVEDVKATLKNKVSPRISQFEVKGLRKQVIRGDIIGWMFYGWASS